jgi:hypothetical protein
MGNLADLQHKHFSDRIKRIETGGPNTSGTIYAGINDAAQPKRGRKRKKKAVAMDRSDVFSSFFMIPFALFLGVIAMMGGRIGAFQAMARPDVVPSEYATLFELAGDIGIAFILASIFMLLFRLTSGARALAFSIGFAAVMLFETSMVQKAPDMFEALFSEEFVTTAIASAPADPFSPEALGL